uniref:phospholipid-hydroperoxide glutathione peroxidase n=1 Tax=Hippocampus comes TaxID=109280 RepID=A0A3Q2XL57_HIPCM
MFVRACVCVVEGGVGRIKFCRGWFLGNCFVFRFVQSLFCAQMKDWQSAKSIYEFSAKDIDGNEVSLEKYRGYVCIIVNVLAEMHASLAEKGLRILGFPCNQFGGQEPGTEAEIKEFAKGFNADFDLFSKIDVNGDNAHPLWKWMKAQPKGKGTFGNNIKWNFTKFLINKEGQVVKRYGPTDDPVVRQKYLHM